MSLYQCSTCGHIEFDTAPDRCLVCRSDRAAYKASPSAIKVPANPAALSEGDRKHIPVVTVSGGKVEVTVGALEHVMQEKHYIVCVDFYLNRKFISRAWLSPETCKPYAAIRVTGTGTVQVIENCNVHGNWLAEAAL